MKKHAIYGLVTSVFFFAGCVSSDMMAVGAKTYPPRPDNYVIEVFCDEEAPIQVQQDISNIRPAAEVPEGAKVIGRVDSRGAPLARWGSLVGDAMSKARSMGGDAILVRAWGQPVSYVGSYGEVQYSKALSFKVLRYQP